ncbi:TPA: transmembrane anchor protein, partial [Pseudomonas aeruginosa]|nr:transmembrane anchor protein [Pseudomonas aeruginosa]
YYHSYSKAKQVKGDKGEFTAIFDGTHGWFWRNRSNRDVTITLKTKGEYLSVKRVI